MVVEFIVSVFSGAVMTVLTAVLPVDGAPDTLGSVVGGILPYYTWLNTWLPLSDAIDLAVLSLQVTLVIAGIYVATWTLTKLHILGGSS